MTIDKCLHAVSTLGRWDLGSGAKTETNKNGDNRDSRKHRRIQELHLGVVERGAPKAHECRGAAGAEGNYWVWENAPSPENFYMAHLVVFWL